MTILFLLLDLSIVAAAFLSGYFWWLASRKRLRRIGRDEMLDHADFNRLVVSYNRTQILNARAAIATAVAGIFAAMRLSGNMFAEIFL
ncbi:hypothetical protein [Altererythrobacter aquiaggeris]|uniref:hypothetical protein n=1 Tax=Aestuarierythrobacter aquiaggeris TaxID=1898396 RepID=UPI00301A032A